jgi:hypothetical protein
VTYLGVAASFGHADDEKTQSSKMEARRRAGAALERRMVHIPDTLADADYHWGVNYRSEKEMGSTIRRTQVQLLPDSRSL